MMRSSARSGSGILEGMTIRGRNEEIHGRSRTSTSGLPDGSDGLGQDGGQRGPGTPAGCRGRGDGLDDDLYRGMDIGTAKPTVDGARWCAAPPDRRDRRLGIRQRGRLSPTGRSRSSRRSRSGANAPLLVGGTALWLKALLRGLFDGPGSDPGLRIVSSGRRKRAGGKPTLHDRLAALDPVVRGSAASPRPAASRPRAWRSIAMTGRPLERTSRSSTNVRHRLRVPVIALELPRTEPLRPDQSLRVLGFFELGLVEEVHAPSRPVHGH